ncbi:MAG: hypothetical protein KM296_00415, partial [Brockia lithotrophica]|nr:hypothetical protein [Brockia lithotrophica]
MAYTAPTNSGTGVSLAAPLTEAQLLREIQEVLSRFPHLDGTRFLERTLRAVRQDPAHDPYDYAVRNALDEIRIGAE